MNQTTDTIAAICTAPGKAAISIVRVSGPDAFAVADAVFRGKGQPSLRPAGTFMHGFVHGTGSDPDAAHDLDEVILLLYRAPRSYTREDVVEFQGHGGQAAARRILAATLQAGARLAEPGEFTRRAFLGGRIDLVQAEAVMDLINAGSDRAAMCAMEQLEGSLSSCVLMLYDALLYIVADLEASLDFGEDEVPEPVLPEIVRRLTGCREGLDELLRTWREGRLLREGAVVVIAGRPNVGKSSLLNRLLGMDRAIVTDLPGTTRDTIEETVLVHGVPIRLVDTAGLRLTDCRVEQSGITRTRSMLERADLTVYLIDATQGLSPVGPFDISPTSGELWAEDLAQLARLDPLKTMVVVNKWDLVSYTPIITIEDGPVDLAISAETGQGIEDLKDAIATRLGVSADDAMGVYISERHRVGIARARQCCAAALEQLNEQREELVVTAAAELRGALEALGEILGRNYDTTLLDAIFSRFCIGK